MHLEFLNLSDIVVDDLPSEQMQLIAEHCGVSDALTLMDKLPGLELYIPAAGKKILDHQYIIEHYTGFNSATIAVHLGIERRKVERLAKRTLDASAFSNDHMRLVAETCGEDVTTRLIQHFSRYRFYIPSDGFSIIRRRYIERTFDGTNTQSLALQCQVSERYVRSVVSDMYAAKSQISFLDILHASQPE